VLKLKPVLLVASSCCYWALLISATSSHLGLPELLLAANTHHTAQLTAKLTAANANGAHGTRPSTAHARCNAPQPRAQRAVRSGQLQWPCNTRNTQHCTQCCALLRSGACWLLVQPLVLVLGVTWCGLQERVPPVTWVHGCGCGCGGRVAVAGGCGCGCGCSCWGTATPLPLLLLLPRF
jgi:hypothetical protein